MWVNSKFFKYGMSVLLLTAIIFMLGQIEFFLSPFKKFVAVLFFPIILSAAFYYLLRPIVRGLTKLKLSLHMAIAIVFLFSILFVSLVSVYAGGFVVNEFQDLFNDIPQMVQLIREKADSIRSNESYVAIYRDKIEGQISTLLQNIVPSVRDGIAGALGTISNIASIFVVVPFMVFYLLKDDRDFYAKIKNLIPLQYRADAVDILKETDKTLSTYIIGQAIIALILGIMTYIGYKIIGLEYAFVLALFICITSFIPMFGVIVGVVPAILVGLTQNPQMFIKIAIVCVVVQFIEGNFVSPYVIGKRLDLHPLTIIIIFLAAASLYGFVGMILAVPVYAVLKVISSGIWKIVMISREVEKLHHNK
jgi:predicted PurR-regulated permease PerM